MLSGIRISAPKCDPVYIWPNCRQELATVALRTFSFSRKKRSDILLLLVRHPWHLINYKIIDNYSIWSSNLKHYGEDRFISRYTFHVSVKVTWCSDDLWQTLLWYTLDFSASSRIVRGSVKYAHRYDWLRLTSCSFNADNPSLVQYSIIHLKNWFGYVIPDYAKYPDRDTKKRYSCTLFRLWSSCDEMFSGVRPFMSIIR